MRIAVVGCGEVGLVYAKSLSTAGHLVELCDPKPSALAFGFSDEVRAPLREGMGRWVASVDIVLSCVTGTAAQTVASQTLPMMRTGALFADMTTSDPGHKRQAAEQAVALGVLFADVAIMGAIALSGVGTRLLCAGSGAARASSLFSSIGSPMLIVHDGAAGDAATLKLLRSVFTKGLEALAVECLLAAERQGATERLYEALADIDEVPLRDTIEAFVRTHVIHAARRMKEVEEAERQLRNAGVPVDVLPGVRHRFQRTARYIDDNHIGNTNPTATEALSWLLVNAAGGDQAQSQDGS
ncbi:MULTISPECIES: NAD(P)-dependent oxidoreductase [unclassified Mesorhizobium]|uniref:NAD(P)-dependent oxidoreductase n=1 Tax=unclassified Mesorhizobium TaxID=325217 RepID=UPI000FCAF8ED|nr:MULTISPECIES: NAD(P)-dependent oxidoreductase [unclassified Mesorhizobium]TGP18222.1 NAD(P)-dependent oxidoreductase [Mesorhizobium sp. M1D.F.Ca.ET.231.01.1.1]TGP25460.1 NAD(P)-dependent oxidoreductase [Mesorhizobium sp. M1D.F.Ca.ET.234.01.1.1]TGS38346.1 NAD(P)-dependent oxidoreductase [Mesorhizobium sp. M1D.F.Ca.ET.184.01.1.1]TGS58353.1 NAD(P)-dependent oxidoreductase [Mesorhizobium sp. M1D.F.Ca.ET.183.01.1.1]